MTYALREVDPDNGVTSTQCGPLRWFSADDEVVGQWNPACAMQAIDSQCDAHGEASLPPGHES